MTFPCRGKRTQIAVKRRPKVRTQPGCGLGNRHIELKELAGRSFSKAAKFPGVSNGIKIAAGRNYWCPPAASARAQDLYTLDPDIAADEVVAGKYERYLAS